MVVHFGVSASIRYRFFLVRRMSELPATAGEAMKPSSSRLTANFSKLRPGLITVVFPDSLKK